MDQGSIYTCKDHPTLRWFDTKPGGQLVFMGELVEADGQRTLKEAAFDPGPPLARMRHYINGRNPFAPELKLDEPFTFEQMKEFMRYVFKMEELGYVFECECPIRLLTRLPDETYESLRR